VIDMGLFDEIETVVDDVKLVLQTKWFNLVYDDGKVKSEGIGSIRIKNVKKGIDAIIWVEGWIILKPKKNATLPCYEDCLLNRYKVGSEVKPGIKIVGVENIRITGVRLEIEGLLDLKSEEIDNEEINVKAWRNKNFNETVVSIEFKKPFPFARKNVDKAVKRALTILKSLYA